MTTSLVVTATCSEGSSLALVVMLANRALSVLGDIAVLVADARGALDVLLVYEGLYALLDHGDVGGEGGPGLSEHLLDQVVVPQDLQRGGNNNENLLNKTFLVLSHCCV